MARSGPAATTAGQRTDTPQLFNTCLLHAARIHRIASEMLTELGASSKLNAEWEFFSLLRDEGRRSAQVFLKNHARAPHDPQSVGALVLEVEETRISMSPSGVEHREIRWRRATLPEAKMVLESCHTQENLAMSAAFTATAIAGTKRKVNGHADSGGIELKDVANGQDVTLVPQNVLR